MAGLVDYDSSSSSDPDSDLCPNKRMRSSPASCLQPSDVSFSAAEKVGNGRGDYLENDTVTQLLEMGCSFDLILHATSVCEENTPVADLFDFIEAYKCALEEEIPAPREEIPAQKLMDDDPLSRAEWTDFEENEKFTLEINAANREGSCSRIPLVEDETMPTLQKLEELGFSRAQIQKASDQCSSIDFDILLNYLLLESYDCDKVNAFYNEDLEAIAAPSGFSSYALNEDLASSESTDFDELLNIDLFGSLKKKREAAGVEGHVGTSCMTDADSSLTSIPSSEAEASFRFDVYKQDDNSRVSYAPNSVSRQDLGAAIRWTKAMENLWCGYMGGAKKFECSPLPDSDGSAELFQPDWEDENHVSRDCKKKASIIDCKRIDNDRPCSSKMMGFGIPGFPIGRPKQLPRTMTGPPYFYFENVAGVPNKEWETIKRHFNGVDPEFTDSKFFSASRRPRGYVHNLPIEGRTAGHYKPLMTIFEAFPHMQKYWPQWDTREKLNCINTRKAADKMCGLIRTLFAMYEYKELPFQRQQEIVQVCKKWNLVWVGPGKAAPLEPHEIELLLGFDQDHTRGCASTTERYDALGNSFQVDTVAYHLSPLKALYPNGVTVLSLFSGIGGAEVALNKLGIYLKMVIAVEINEKVRGVLEAWWRRSGQKGELRLKNDVREMTYEVLADLVDEVGPIDFIVGGSPCNNLSGNNRVSRNGLSGSESSLFFEFPRILNIVKQVMRERGYV